MKKYLFRLFVIAAINFYSIGFSLEGGLLNSYDWSFEDNPLSHWTLGSQMLQSTATVFDGSYAIFDDDPPATTGSTHEIVQNTGSSGDGVAITAGNDYVAAIKVYTPDGKDHISVTITIFWWQDDSASTAASTSYNYTTVTVTTNNTWQTLSTTSKTAPADANYATVRYRVKEDDAGSHDVYFDAAELREGSTKVKDWELYTK